MISLTFDSLSMSNGPIKTQEMCEINRCFPLIVNWTDDIAEIRQITHHLLITFIPDGYSLVASRFHVFINLWIYTERCQCYYVSLFIVPSTKTSRAVAKHDKLPTGWNGVPALGILLSIGHCLKYPVCSNCRYYRYPQQKVFQNILALKKTKPIIQV